VDSVNWQDAVDFCQRLSEKDGRRYDLPTEAEWEYACRAGTLTAFHFGANLSSRQANFNNSLGRTCEVGMFPANPWGLHDLHGNVWEWCKDRFDENFYKNSPTTDPECTSGMGRILRGGTWRADARACRSAYHQQQKQSAEPDPASSWISSHLVSPFTCDSHYLLMTAG